MKKPIAGKREIGNPHVSSEPEIEVTVDASGRVVGVRYISENGTGEEAAPLPDKNGRRSAINLGYSGRPNKDKAPALRARVSDIPLVTDEARRAILRWEENATPDAAAIKLKGFGKPKDLVGLPQDAASVVTRSVRMSSDLLDGIRDAAHAEGVSQEEWMRRQYMKGIGVKEPPAPPSGRSASVTPRFSGLSVSERSPKKQIALRLEPELLDAFERAAKESGFPKNDWLRAAIVKALDEGLDVRAVLEPPSSN